MKTLFITGASGFIGRHLLAKIDHKAFNRVYCLIRTSKLPSVDHSMRTPTPNLLLPAILSCILQHQQERQNLRNTFMSMPRGQNSWFINAKGMGLKNLYTSAQLQSSTPIYPAIITHNQRKPVKML
jgi:hypothetical protein